MILPALYHPEELEWGKIYGLPVRIDEPQEHLGSDGTISYTFPETTQAYAGADKVATRIRGAEFIPLSQALTSKDLFTHAAAGVLWRHLALGALYGSGMVAPPQWTRPTESNANQ